MCNGICKRLYKARRKAPGASMYIDNKRCTNCDRFISMEGVYRKSTSWNCKCCDAPVRHTPYSGRKSIERLYVGPVYKLTIDNVNC